MKYVVLVSHGTFAPGLQSVLEMLAGGGREDIISVGLEDGMSADRFVEKLAQATEVISAEDEVILLGDILGGSPLTQAADLFTRKGLESQTICFGGMNLGMALTAVLDKDFTELEEMRTKLVESATEVIREFAMVADDADEDDI